MAIVKRGAWQCSGIFVYALILQAGKCKVFKAMLKAGMSECSLDKVKILDMTAQEMQALVDFIYNVSQRSLEKHVVALFKASHKYDLPSLTKLSERFMQSYVFRDIPGAIEISITYESKHCKRLCCLIFSTRVLSRAPSFVVKTSGRILGLSSKVIVLKGTLSEVLGDIKEFLSEMTSSSFDFICMYHFKHCYLSDFLLVKEISMLDKGTYNILRNWRLRHANMMWRA